MFSLEVDDELKLVVETVRKFAQQALAPAMRDSERARSVDPGLHGAYEKIGLAALDLPDSLDGAGMGCLARVIVNEELAAGDAGAALALDRAGPALLALHEFGGDAAARALLDRIGDGRALLLLDEDARVVCSQDAIDIEAPWVPANEAAAIVVLRGDEALLVSDGIEFEALRGAGLRAAGASSLSVRSAEVAGRWTSRAGATRARARARLYFASLLLGVMRASCDFATAYARERRAFGRPIAHHQALAFLIVDMHMALEAARLVVHEAAWRVDRQLPCGVEAASAFAECIDASRSIGPDGVQILGGHGFMADYPAEKHMREARALGLACGGFDAAVQEAGLGLCASRHPLALAVEGTL